MTTKEMNANIGTFHDKALKHVFKVSKINNNTININILTIVLTTYIFIYTTNNIMVYLHHILMCYDTIK